jgi:hypothetical protein
LPDKLYSPEGKNPSPYGTHIENTRKKKIPDSIFPERASFYFQILMKNNERTKSCFCHLKKYVKKEVSYAKMTAVY